MIKNYQNIQESNVSGKIAVQLHEEAKALEHEQEKILEEDEANI